MNNNEDQTMFSKQRLYTQESVEEYKKLLMRAMLKLNPDPFGDKKYISKKERENINK